ncbi:hypothetical protein BGZ96_009813 [Linnemannia gamsii]|uniref:F-box domain-containing protein n=1 Tax=Linnemannia gamsii TaxID=64522 RepID=A0ABQ7JVS1_9FUNG|nr:hypothetical protein BGZ96_009813 [Linnemannia gamsii]
MATASELFFGIQDLVDILASHLSQQDLARLTRTCRSLHQSCTPAYYRNLSIGTVGEAIVRVFNSTSGMVALGRHIQPVRKVYFGVEELAYFYKYVLAFENIQSHTTTDPPRPQRPSWLPPPDTLTNELKLEPLPSMINLVDFSRVFEDADNAYKLPDATDFRVMTAQLRWVLSLIQHLTCLYLEDINKVTTEMTMTEPSLFKPYYSRTHPITLTEAEVAHFLELEIFDRKIEIILGVEKAVCNQLPTAPMNSSVLHNSGN